MCVDGICGDPVRERERERGRGKDKDDGNTEDGLVHFGLHRSAKMDMYR
jgi:hypothetical protein